MAQFIYKLAEVVMFVITSSPCAINRMKARKGGFFKGKVLKETSRDVWIEPMNDELTERLAKLSFFRDVAVINKKQVVVLNDNEMDDPQWMKSCLQRRYKTKDVRFADCVIIPKRQVEHWLGEKRRFNDAMQKLASSHLVKKGNTKKAKPKKVDRWTYRPAKPGPTLDELTKMLK